MKTKRNRGQTLMLLAIALPAFIGALGLAVDVGNLFFTRTKLQTADDASVLAGTLCLAADASCSAVPTATSYAETAANGVAASEIVSGPTVGTAPDGNPDLSMTLRRTVPFYFARLVGITQAPVQVAATAEIGPANEVFNAFPVGLQYCLPGMTTTPAGPTCPYTEFDTTLTFAAKKNDGSGSWVTGPGNWSAVDLPNTTPTNTVSTCPPPAATCIGSNPGFAKIKALIAEANALIGNATPNVVIPVVDWTGCNGRCPLNVYEFAEIKLISASDKGPNNSTITAQFIQYVDPGRIGPPGTPSIGAFAEKLIE